MEQHDPKELGFDAERLERVSSITERYIEAGEIAGAVAAVARRGQVAYLRAHGRRDIEHDSPMTSDALFRIYSMSKPIATAALMMFVERGLVRLTDPLSRFVPEFAGMSVYLAGEEPPFRTEPADREILVWDLLTHTAGLAYGIGDEHPVEKEFERTVWAAAAGNPALSLADLSALIARLPLVHHPGTNWRYSVACDLMGAIIEVVTGRSFAEVLATDVFAPLGMHETWFTIPESEYPRVAQVYAMHENGLEPDADPPIMAYWGQRAHPSGGGGLVSTVADYLKFEEMLRNEGKIDDGFLLSPRTVRTMMQDHLPPGVARWDDPGAGFGFGGRVITDTRYAREYGSVGQYSWGGAANTHFWIDPQERISAVVMLQRVPAFEIQITDDIRTAVYQALVD
ncbi:MAG TPA: serine hydrolase domain-containing protein [Spirochaetia bacterium]|nr:serine hydrolase domain-containing protein [Spirochaetia bacterium]